MKKPTQSRPPSRGIIQEIGLEANLLLQLIIDRRVNFFLKLIPVAGLLYVISPFDFSGWLDDAFVLIVSLVFFVELCPRQVVDEHRARLRQVIDGEWHDVPKDDTVIDGEFRDAPDQAPPESNEKK